MSELPPIDTLPFVNYNSPIWKEIVGLDKLVRETYQKIRSPETSIAVKAFHNGAISVLKTRGEEGLTDVKTQIEIAYQMCQEYEGKPANVNQE